MPEWSIGTVLKTVVGESLPWVRIPPPPFHRDATMPRQGLRLPRLAASTLASRQFAAVAAIDGHRFDVRILPAWRNGRR